MIEKPPPKPPPYPRRSPVRFPAIPPPPKLPSNTEIAEITVDFDTRLPPDPLVFPLDRDKTPVVPNVPSIAWQLAKKVFDDATSEDRRRELADLLLVVSVLDEDGFKRVRFVADALLYKRKMTKKP